MTRIGRIDNDFQEFKELVLKRLDDIENRLNDGVKLKEVNLRRVMDELPKEGEEKPLPKHVDDLLRESTKKNKLITKKRWRPPKKTAEDKSKEGDITLEAKNGEIIAVD